MFQFKPIPSIKLPHRSNHHRLSHTLITRRTKNQWNWIQNNYWTRQIISLSTSYTSYVWTRYGFRFITIIPQLTRNCGIISSTCSAGNLWWIFFSNSRCPRVLMSRKILQREKKRLFFAWMRLTKGFYILYCTDVQRCRDVGDLLTILFQLCWGKLVDCTRPAFPVSCSRESN